MRADLPVVPDRDAAREWLGSELQKPEYAERESLLTRLLTWILERLSEIQWPGASMSGAQLGIAIAVVAVAVVVIAWLVAGPVRLGRERSGSATVLDAEDTRTAAQLRRSADAAAASGDWHTAVVERFRAVVRSLEDRVVIEPRPGRTAQEAATDAGRRLPGQAAGLRAGADLFDGVEYGDRQATAADDATLRTLDTEVAAARAAAASDREAGPGSGPETAEHSDEQQGVSA